MDFRRDTFRVRVRTRVLVVRYDEPAVFFLSRAYLSRVTGGNAAVRTRRSTVSETRALRDVCINTCCVVTDCCILSCPAWRTGRTELFIKQCMYTCIKNGEVIYGSAASDGRVSVFRVVNIKRARAARVVFVARGRVVGGSRPCRRGSARVTSIVKVRR